MRIVQRLFLDLVILLLVLVCGMIGAFQPLDSVLKDFRFQQSSHAVTGDIVYVAVDSDALNTNGVWPWPRRLHAQVIDNLIAMGATQIVLDIDFSTSSNVLDDALLVRALENAGDRVVLAAFGQTVDDGQNMASFRLPVQKFLQHSEPVTSSVVTDKGGRILAYPYGVAVGNKVYSSIAAMFAGREPTAGTFPLDYSIDVSSIDQIPISEVLTGVTDPIRIAGKQVIVGVSVPALRDTYSAPKYGALPGSVLHIMAAETLKQGRVQVNYGTEPAILLAMLLAGVYFLLRWRNRLAVAVGVVAAILVGVEIVALVLHLTQVIIFETMTVHIALATLVVADISREIDARHFLLGEATRERDTTRNLLNQVISDNFDGVVVVSDQGIIITASQLAKDMLGFDNDSASDGLDVDVVLPSILATEIRVALKMRDELPPSPEVTEVIISDATGAERTIEYVITLSSVEPNSGMEDTGSSDAVACLTFRDVTERRATEKRLTYLAGHDPLTGAMSRSKLADVINSAMATEDGRFVGMTIIMLDLSRFKVINDTLGHSYGDLLLKEVVARFASCDVDCVARMGGDSFAAARAGLLSGSELDGFCAEILRTVSDVYQIEEHRAIIGAQIGLTDTEVSGFEPDVLISHADMALSAAKAAPVNGYAVYNQDMDDRLNEMQDMEVALRHAIAHDEFILRYQPQVLLEDGDLMGVEALVRWNHPSLGMVSPVKFIPLAEETGLILELGRWVLITACKQAALWPEKIKLAVNVSPMQFEFGDVVEDVRYALEVSQLSPKRLDIEITEGVFISKPQLVTQKLQELKALGVEVALDDFGTGFSSLAYLGQLPIDKIKIDQAFVRGLPEDQHSAAVVRAIMTLSESLGKIVVAEGIENADQAWMLQLAGCHIGQGYHFGKPLEAQEITDRIAAQQKTDASLAI